jgi:DNA-binding FadR family transcriptional regulator
MELRDEIELIRAKLAAGSATDEDLRRGIQLLRQGRVTATATAGSTTKAKEKAALASISFDDI